MSSRAKIVAGALVAVALVVALWLVGESGPPARPTRQGAAPATAPAPATAAAPATASAPLREAPFRERERVPEPPITAESNPAPLPAPEPVIRGRVLDVHGRPVPGAHVVAEHRPGAELMTLDAALGEAREAVGETHAGAGGAFALAVPADRALALVVSSPGCATARRWPVRAGAELEVWLEAAGTLAGELVRRADGAPVPGVRLRLWRRDVLVGDGESDALGRFRFEDLAPGSVVLVPEPVELAAPGWIEVDLRPGELAWERIELDGGRRVRGTVTDAVTGAPIAGATVGEGFFVYKTTRTDAQGRYVLEGQGGPLSWQLHAWAQGYGRRQEPVPPPASGASPANTASAESPANAESAESPANAETPASTESAPSAARESRGAPAAVPEAVVDFALLPALRARGRVVAASGEPVADAYVAAAAYAVDAEHGRASYGWQSTRSAADGTFELADLRPDLHPVLLVRAAGHASALRDFPPAFATAGAVDSGGTSGMAGAVDSAETSGAAGAVDSAGVSDTAGTSGAGAGSELGGGGVIELGDVVLPAAAAIAGDVIDENVEPVAGVEVVLRLADAARYRLSGGGALASPFVDDRVAERRTRTDALGRFRFDGVPPGEHLVWAWFDGGTDVVERAVLVEEGRDVTGVRLRMRLALSIEGRVVDEQGEPVPRAIVRVWSEGAHATRVLTRITDAGGRFVARGLEPRRYALLVEPPRAETPSSAGAPASAGTPSSAGAPAEQTERRYAPTALGGVAPGAHDLELVLRAPAVVSGVVRTPAGAPLAGVEVRALDASDRPFARTTTDATGRFALELEPGTSVTLEARRPASTEGAAPAAPSRRTGVRAPSSDVALVLPE